MIVNDAEDINAAGGVISITEPAGLAVNELLLCECGNFLNSGSAPIPATISGFVSDGTAASSAANALVSRGMHRVADGTEGPTYTSTITGSSEYSTGKMLRIIGVDPVNPIDGWNGAGSVVATLNLPAVTVTNGPCLAVAFVGMGNTITGAPTGWTLYGIWDTTQAVYYRWVDTGQSTGTAMVTASAAGANNAHVFTIKGLSGYPKIAGLVTEIGTSMGAANAQPTFAAPAHAGAAGDLCIYLAGSDNPGATDITASTDWTVLDHTAQGANVIKGAWIARVLDGAHGSGNNTLSLSGAAQDYAVAGIIIPAGQHSVVNVSTDMPRGTPSSAASGNADPPSVTFVQRRYLVLAGAIVDATTGNNITAIPTNYGLLLLTKSANSTSSVMLGIAGRFVEDASEDPGVFTNPTQENLGFTLCIPAGDVAFGGRQQVLPPQAVHRAANW